MGKASNDPIGDLLDGIMNGADGGRNAGGSGRKQANPLDEIFGQEQPGTGTQPSLPGLPGMPDSGQAGGGSILDILGDILGSGRPGGQQTTPQQRPGTPSGAGGIEDILGDILGGGQPGGQQTTPQQRPGLPGGAGGIEDILGDILGGGQPGGQQTAPQQMPGGGIEDILGGILGGGMPGGNIAGNPILAPIVNGISKKLGLPPAIVAIGLSLILSRLLSKASQAQGQPGQQRSPRVPGQINPPGKSQQPGNLDLDDILGRMRKDGVDRSVIENSGVVGEVAQETGLGQNDAGQLIEEIIGALGEEGSAKPMPRQSGRGAEGHGGLKDILDTW